MAKAHGVNQNIKLIDKAEAAYRNGDVDSAIGMLRKAHEQGQMALVEARAQADAAMNN